MFITNKIAPYHVVLEKKKIPRKKMINQYLLVSKLGTGYFSKVYLALKQEESKDSLGNTVIHDSYYAAKAIHVHEHFESTAPLEREIHLLRELSNPYIIKFYSVLYAPTNDVAYILMEWANCGTLQESINKNIKFDEKIIASIFIQISLALSYVHSKGIIHHDVKPSNILLFSNGTAKLCDFGISHSFESAESVTGTPAYQAPDLFDEDSDFSSRYGDSTSSSVENSESFFQILKNSKDTTILTQKKENNKNGIINKVSDEKAVMTIISDQTSKSKNISCALNYQKSNEFTDIITQKEKKKNDPKKSDVWSLGISMFQTAFGSLPYNGKNVYEIVNMINTSSLIFPHNSDRQYSPLFFDLLVKMLKKKSIERLSLEEVIQHPFFVRYETTIPEKKIELNSDLIIINNNKVMKKVKFDIKPIQPPEHKNIQIVKIDAIDCPDNYTFSSNSIGPSLKFSLNL